MGEEVFADYLKFAFVRNPFDRFVSYCAFATSREGSFERDPKAVMRHFAFTAPPHNHIIFRPQDTFLVAPDGSLPADVLGKIESMQACYDQICASLGIASTALDHTRHIVFRFVSDFSDWRTSYDRPIWAEWQHLLQPVIEAATAEFGYDNGVYPRVMLSRMAAGGVIHPHRDANTAAKWPHKIHVPIITNDQVWFRIEGTSYQMVKGEAAELNNMGVHAVENQGSTDRIHSIFEYYDPDQPSPNWLDAIKR